MRANGAVACALLGACSSAAAGYPRSTSLAPIMLQAHNLERSAMGAAPLRWDPRLAAAADAYAAQLARTGRWGHSAPYQRVGQGENLWMGSRGAFSPSHMVAGWVSERRMFRAGVFPNISRSGSWNDVGHYTQMIWPTTTAVGCSVRSSPQWDYLVCRYSSPGNVSGERVGPTRIAAR